MGYVSERDLPGLTKAVTAFAYPSLYEGFGFPVAQAMACRVPVLTSSTSCLPEITGDGAVQVDPRSVAEIAAGLGRLLDSAELRASMGAAGFKRAAEHFRWSVCAAKSWEFFRKFS